MRALVVSLGYNTNFYPLIQHLPTPMLRIIDKEIILHLVEFLAGQGILHYEIILSYKPELIEQCLEDGKKWGVTIRYHLSKSYETPFKIIIPSVEEWNEESILLCNAETLPDLHLNSLFGLCEQEELPIFIMTPQKNWTGWAIYRKKCFASLNLGELNYEDLFIPNGYSKTVTSYPKYELKQLEDLRAANIKMLNQNKEALHFPSTTQLLVKQIWTSRAVSIDPTVTIHPPVFIGESTVIQAHSSIGPNVVIENHSLIGGQTMIENSIICRHSFIGEGLTIKDSIIDRDTLINLQLKTCVHITDEFILSEAETFQIRDSIFRFITRMTAALFIMLLSPFFLYGWLTHHLNRKKVVYIPLNANSSNWQVFYLLSFKKKNGSKSKKKEDGFINSLPMLINILKGHLHFTGLPPRTIQEVMALPKEWQEIYLKGQAGIVNLASVELDKNASSEEIFTSEALYVVKKSFFWNVKLFLRWLYRKGLKNYLH
ncbi:MAG: hypothetical protein Tsb0021_14670 [Chlamydiales bacterium]